MLGKRQRRYNYVLFPFSVRFETMQYVVRLACAFCTPGKFSTYSKFYDVQDVHDVRPTRIARVAYATKTFLARSKLAKICYMFVPLQSRRMKVMISVQQT